MTGMVQCVAVRLVVAAALMANVTAYAQDSRVAKSSDPETQTAVAECLGVSPSYISAVEAGRRNLTLGQLANIANAMRLGIDISFIHPDGKPVRLDQT